MRPRYGGSEMRWTVLALLTLAGCIERPQYREPDPTPIPVPVRPPEQILRLPPEFEFRDYASGKQFYYRTYSDAEVTLEIVTVVAPGGTEEMDATAEEKAYAMKVLVEDWQGKNLQER